MTMSIVPGDSAPIRGAHKADAVGVHAFPRLSVLLHWLTAAMVLTMFCTGVLMKQIGDGAMADALYTFHKTAGATLLCIVILRLSYRLMAYLGGRWQKGAGSHAVHAVLYGLLVAVPLLGLAGISDYGARVIYFGVSLPLIWPEGAGYAAALFKSHAVLAFTLIGLVAVHIGLALSDYIQRGAQREAMPAGARRGPDEAVAVKNAFPAGSDMP